VYGRNWAKVLGIVTTTTLPGMSCTTAPTTETIVSRVTTYRPIEIDAIDVSRSASSVAVNEDASTVIHIVCTIPLSTSVLGKIVIHPVPSKGATETIG
jgi:hypothetical protein